MGSAWGEVGVGSTTPGVSLLASVGTLSDVDVGGTGDGVEVATNVGMGVASRGGADDEQLTRTTRTTVSNVRNTSFMLSLLLTIDPNRRFARHRALIFTDATSDAKVF